MIRIIDQFFNGDAAQAEKLFLQSDEKRQNLLNDAETKMDLLSATFTDKQKELFEEWLWANDGLWVYEVETAYVRGFKTGAHVIIEVYDFNV